jgi:hypothetical protein
MAGRLGLWLRDLLDMMISIFPAVVTYDNEIRVGGKVCRRRIGERDTLSRIPCNHAGKEQLRQA